MKKGMWFSFEWTISFSAVSLYFCDFAPIPFILSWKVVGIDVMLLVEKRFVAGVGLSLEGNSVCRRCSGGIEVAGCCVAAYSGHRLLGGLVVVGVVGLCFLAETVRPVRVCFVRPVAGAEVVRFVMGLCVVSALIADCLNVFGLTVEGWFG